MPRARSLKNYRFTSEFGLNPHVQICAAPPSTKSSMPVM
jgi:hypothetical protein